MIPGSTRRRTSLNAARTRGERSVLGRYDGSAATTVAMACSASAVRPSARRQNARYCSIARDSSRARPDSGRRLRTANASSYAAEAYRSRAAAIESCPAATVAVINSRDATTPTIMRDIVSLLLLPHVNAYARRRRQRHGRGVFLLAEFWVPEHDLVRANRKLQVADRRLADFLAVDVDVGPRLRVDGDRSLRPLKLDRRDLAGPHLDRPDGAVAERVADHLDLVLARGEHQPIALARAEQPLVLVQLQFDRRRHTHPAGQRGAVGRRRQRHHERS